MKKIVCAAAALILCMTGYALAGPEIKRMIEPEKSLGEVQVIHLNRTGGITPASAIVRQGTTVVWMNESGALLELQFEGAQVTVACKSPVHFIVDESGSFVSDRIPEGSVASLCFVEKGEFPYVLRPAGGSRSQPKDFRGSIIVK